MSQNQIFCKFALIGDNLELKQNVSLEINNEGMILNIEYDDIEKEIDISKKKNAFIMIPGFINSHIHIGDSFAKEIGFNQNLKAIVSPPNGIKHRLLKGVAKEIKVEGIKNAIREMISSGITCFVDFRERNIEGIHLLNNILKKVSINHVIFGRFRNLEEIESIFKVADGIGLPSYHNISSKMKETLNSNKEKYKKKIACHCAELERNESLINEVFNDGIVDIIIHGTHFIKEDLEQINKKKLSLVLCPRSNGYFGTGFPPILNILELKIPISLGTDNIMANNPDLFEEMRYFYRIARVLCNNKINVKISAKDILKMVTINAARNFKIDKNLGSISKGKMADFFLINLNDPNFYSMNIDINKIYPLIMQRTKSENIKKTYVRGEIVFERK
jgi:cytosine/adenosine deaminase-related metal-dependent hydrolase